MRGHCPTSLCVHYTCMPVTYASGRLAQLRYLSRTCTHPARLLVCYHSQLALSSLVPHPISCGRFPTYQRSSRPCLRTTFRGLRYLRAFRTGMRSHSTTHGLLSWSFSKDEPSQRPVPELYYRYNLAAAFCMFARFARRYALAFAHAGCVGSAATAFACCSANCSAYQTDQPLRGLAPASTS